MQRLCLIALCSVMGLAVVPASAQDGSFEPWIGTYESPDPEQAERIIKRAIETGTRDMGFLRRKIARKRLKSVNPAYKQVRIFVEDNQLVTDYEGRRYRAPLHGGEARGIDPDGEPVIVSYRRNAQTLLARYVGEDGEKRVAFELNPNGEDLTMHVTVLSDQLPEPIRYSLPYERAE